jgi:hypothetical protein
MVHTAVPWLHFSILRYRVGIHGTPKILEGEETNIFEYFMPSPMLGGTEAALTEHCFVPGIDPRYKEAYNTIPVLGSKFTCLGHNLYTDNLRTR